MGIYNESLGNTGIVGVGVEDMIGPAGLGDTANPCSVTLIDLEIMWRNSHDQDNYRSLSFRAFTPKKAELAFDVVVKLMELDGAEKVILKVRPTKKDPDENSWAGSCLTPDRLITRFRRLVLAVSD